MIKNSVQRPKISFAETKNALYRSGYLLESRIEKELQDRNYFVDTNTAYLDPLTNKSRELDIYSIGGQRLSKRDDFLFPVLLIECVNNPQPLAFFTKESQLGIIAHYNIRISGLPVKILRNKKDKEWESLSEFIKMQKYHHYCKGKVATQFCSFTKKKNSDEWMAQHENSHFDVVQKLCDATNYYINEHFTSWVITDNETINLQIYYPIIIIQGELLDIQVKGKNINFKKIDHVLFQKTIIHQGEASEYFIDVITEKYFKKYLQIVEEEISIITERLKKNRRIIQLSIDEIAKKSYKLKSKENIRKALEF